MVDQTLTENTVWWGRGEPPRRDLSRQLSLRLFPRVLCPDCGGPLVTGEGYVTCAACGFCRER